jgi:DNA-binding response OmpR family regulator
MRKKILILDDDEDIAALMDVLLTQHGYQTIVAHSSAVFADLLQIDPDLILLDNRLGDGFGKDYCRQLKADPVTARFKIILVSAAHDIESFSKDSCADAFLIKPFDIKTLLDLINSMT